MEETESCNDRICKNHSPSIKLRAGASIVKSKPLFSFDSRYILVPSGCDVKVFSIASGICTLTFKEHKQPVVGIQINKKNNLQVLSCSEDGTVIRWDYADGKSLMVYKLDMDASISAFFASTVNDWFVISKYQNQHRLYSITIRSETVKKSVLKLEQPHENSIAIGPEGTYVAAINDNLLRVKDLKNNIVKRHMTGLKKLLCVAAHPTKMMLATGDNLGCILVWTEIFINHPTRSIYHWHSLPLADLVFSVEGSHIYSGGGESVLVRWNLNSGTKQTLPRLGLPICLVTVSPDNTYIATSHIDNAIQIISSQNKVIQLIQGLTQGHCGVTKREEVLPTGMLYDPRSNAIIMNGRPGHLQFYNICDDQQLFNLDIVGQNYISQERDSIIFNTDIERAAVDCQGLWLATVECRDDSETSPEIRLKFWKFETSSQKFVLNTNIFLPHHKKINSLRFRPETIDEEEESIYSPLAVTTSSDGRFKVWALGDTNKSNDKLSWSCELMGYYKDLPAADSCFSEDGSLLAVAFNHIATLWTPDTNVLKATLCNSDSVNLIKRVLFGRGKSSHLLVSHTDKKLTVWNVLTLSALWNVNCEVEFLVDDPFSEIMASFSKDNHLYIFKPTDPKPVAVLNNVTSSPVVAAVFVPLRGSRSWQGNAEFCCWQQYTNLYFLNKNQEMLTVADESVSKNEENNQEQVKLHQNLPVTPFGLLQAEHVASNIKQLKSKKHIIYDFNKDENIEVNDFPCPTHVNPVALCAALLSSLLNPRVKITDEEEESCKKKEDSESTDSGPVTKVPAAVKKTADSKSEEPMDTSMQVLPQISDFKYLLDYVKI